MRIATIAATIVLAVCTTAHAAPMAPNIGSQSSPNVVQVWGGCGWGFHPNRWGNCVPNRRAYYGPPPSWHGGYYYRPWGSSSDYVAEELNRRELWRGGYGWGY